MNKEEKKAIEDMNRFANGIDMSCVTARQMQIILNLIERLEKENEKLKKLIAHKNEYTKKLEEDLLENCSNDVVLKRKAKDKIEKLNKEEKEELKGMKGQDRYFVKQIYQNKRIVLQELIEEREEK